MAKGERGVWREWGGMSLEMVLMTPIFVAFLMLLAGIGRTVDAQSQIDGAARDAARSASVARNADDADAFARQTANAGLANSKWCVGGPQVEMAPGSWGPGGQVTITVTCDVDLGDLTFIGLPATKQFSGRSVAPIDVYTYRGTDPGNGDGG